MDGPRTIELSPHERSGSAYDPKNIQCALEGLHQDGLLILKNVINISHIDALRSAMNAETHTLLTTSPRANLYNQGVNSNILQAPPLANENLFFNNVYFNPYIIQIANSYLGSRPIFNFITGNNALTGTQGLRQAVHKDITFHHPTTPFYFIANIVLSDFFRGNGSTEFWLGSHAHTTSEDQIPYTAEDRFRNQAIGSPSCNVKPDVVEARRKIRPPIQPTCKKGDVMIRDLRTWHAGMPNPSPENRSMIAIGYQAPWYQNNTQRLYLPLKHANFWMRAGGQNVEVRAQFLEGPDEEVNEKMWKNYDFPFEPSVNVDRRFLART